MAIQSTAELSLFGPASGTTETACNQNERSDDDLMLLARDGVDSAFDELVRRHQCRVMSVAARYLARSALAADVAQDSFVAVYQALGSYQPRGRFTSYLYRIVLNHCRMAKRRGRVERAAIELASIEEPLELDLVESKILARERQLEVERALGGLSDKLREVVVLRYSGGLSYDEVAEALSIPVGTAKRRHFDAMSRLRQALGGA